MNDPLFGEAGAHLSTIRDLVRFAHSRFVAHGLVFGHGSLNAWDEAVYLILHSLGLPLDELDPVLDARLLPSEVAAVISILEKRCARVPAAYLTHEAWLGPYSFYVDERVIVPRSLIAELLLEGLAPWIENPAEITSVLDLCTGSGCLAILAAHSFPNAKVDAVDISVAALEVTRINIERHGLGARVTPVLSDLFGALQGRRYDLIISNPPYVNDASMQALPAEYRAEPRLALAGGADGLDCVRTILASAGSHLNDQDGQTPLLVVEIGHEAQHFDRAFPGVSCTWLSTSAGDDMVFMMRADELDQV